MGVEGESYRVRPRGPLSASLGHVNAKAFISEIADFCDDADTRCNRPLSTLSKSKLARGSSSFTTNVQ